MRWLLTRLIIGFIVLGISSAANRMNRNPDFPEPRIYAANTPTSPTDESVNILKELSDFGYNTEYNRIIGEFNAIQLELENQFRRPKWGRDDWTTRVVALYDRSIALYDDFNKLVPPSSEEEAHAVAIETMRICKERDQKLRQAVIDVTYRGYTEVEDTLGVQCVEATKRMNEAMDAVPFPTLSPTPTWTPTSTRTPRPTKTPTPRPHNSVPQKP
jgi:hypothetical protein